MLRLFDDPIREQERIIMAENKKKPGHIHSIRVRMTVIFSLVLIVHWQPVCWRICFSWNDIILRIRWKR